MKAAINIYPFVLSHIRYADIAKEDDLYIEIDKNVKFLEKESQKWLKSQNLDLVEFLTEKHLNRIFRLKINLLKWLFRKTTSLKEVYQSTEDLLTEYYRLDDDLATNLCDNLQFVSRTGLRIYKGLKEQMPKGLSFDTIAENLPSKSIEFNELKTLLILEEIPFLTKYIQFLEYNLRLEFITIAAFQVLDNFGNYDSSKVDELSWIIVDTTQELGALALNLGIVQRKSSSRVFEGEPTEDVLKQNKELAEAGIAYWAKNIEEWD